MVLETERLYLREMTENDFEVLNKVLRDKLFIDAGFTTEEEARAAVVTLSVTEAVRDAEAEGLQVKKGQFIGLVNNKLRHAEDDLNTCLRALAGEIGEREIITVYYGEDADESETEALVGALQEILGEDAEILATAGNQPIYRYIISAE